MSMTTASNHFVVFMALKRLLSVWAALCCSHFKFLLLVQYVDHGRTCVFTGSPSRSDVAVYVFDKNHPSLPTPFHSVHVSVSVFMALSTVFHSINSPDNSSLSHSVLPVLFLPYWSFELYISL